MKITTEQAAQIKSQFSELKNVEEFAELLRFIYECIYPKTVKEFIISRRELHFYSIHKDSKYMHFTIPKKNGDRRPISAPVKRLKIYQRLINALLNILFEPHKAAFGFVPGKNIVDNSRKHLAKRFVYNVDLENFFPSIKFRRVKSVLGLPPFNLIDDKEYLAFVIANVCCANGCLPQGAPTSPTLTNIVCQRLDRKLQQFARENKAAYSRYADDITFSSYHEIFDDKFKKGLNKIISDEKFTINDSKVRLQSRSERQAVTGIVVNSKANLSKAYIKRIRFWLYIWNKFGYDKAFVRFTDDYTGQFKMVDLLNEKSLEFKERLHSEKGSIKYNGKIPDLKKVLEGKINFLTMVRGKNDLLSLGYKSKLNKLSLPMEIINKEIDKLGIEKILQVMNVWEVDGINKAIELYKSNYES